MTKYVLKKYAQKYSLENVVVRLNLMGKGKILKRLVIR